MGCGKILEKQTLNYLRSLVRKAQSSQLAPELTGFALPEIALGNAPRGPVVTVRAAASNLNRGEEISVEVRQLRNLIHRLVVFDEKDLIIPADL